MNEKSLSKDAAEKASNNIQELIQKSKEDLISISQKHLSIEQERTFRFKQTKRKYEEDFEKINKKVEEEKLEWNLGWNKILNQNNPLDLETELKEMKNECDQVISIKLNFIKELEQEVMRRDHEYVNKISDQNQQIDEFVKLMRQNLTEIKKKINQELSTLNSIYSSERSSEANSIEKKTKDFQTKRQEKEKQLTNEIITSSINNRDSLEELRQEHTQKLLLERSAFEENLQAHQKEFEDILASNQYLLEKLDYQSRVLTDSQGEHEEKAKLQAKKMSRQSEIIRSLKRKYLDDVKKYKSENAQITNEYKKLAENYRKLQDRFRKVAYADFNSFREVWNLNEKKLYELVLKVNSANEIVTKQQLGKENKEINSEFIKRKIIGTEEFEDLTKTPQALPEIKNIESEPKYKTTGILSNKNLSENLEHLWRLISDEVGFLVDERVKNLVGIPEGEDIENSTMKIKIDLLLQDLGITNEEDTAQLLSHFLRDTEFELETPGFVRPYEVLKGLNSFVQAYKPTIQQNHMSLFSQITSDATQNTSSEVARAIMQLQEKMMSELPEQIKFINKKTEVVSEEIWRIWNAAYKLMQRYVKELDERSKLILDTERLKNQNNEFEMILQKYLESDTNNKLIYSPQQTVDF